MVERTFGIDFGTTNSLVSYVDGYALRTLSFTGPTGRPHPSVVWYRGSDIVVGPEARMQLDAGHEAVSGDFVRSPKRLLAHASPVHVSGREIDPCDVITEVLRFLKEDAAGHERGPEERSNVDRAVFTIPVDLDGEGRARLRRAALDAGISVVQFVHEPMAALYGYLRSQSEFRRRVTELEGQRLLVFDWGGGTLDLTICLVEGGRLIQLANRGSNDVGGDRFDEVIRTLVMEKHAREHGLVDLDGLIEVGARIRLLTACENAKIRLSSNSSAPIVIKGFLQTSPGRDLAVEITRDEVETAVAALAERGLSQIDGLLDDAGLTLQEVAFCLPSGGMINMPIVRNGLLQRFGARLKSIPNGDTIISEGAAWIAHDGARVTLAKPVEILNPDNTYSPFLERDFLLPVENQTVRIPQRMFYCVDPRDGLAHFQFARPKRVGYGSRVSDRLPYGTVSLKVDPNVRPLLERIEALAEVDADYIVRIELYSTGRCQRASLEIYDLEFALELPQIGDDRTIAVSSDSTGPTAPTPGAVVLRSNVTTQREGWGIVPGDVVGLYQSAWFDRRGGATEAQVEERLYYQPCATCRRSSFDCAWEGCDDPRCSQTLPSRAEAASRRGACQAQCTAG